MGPPVPVTARVHTTPRIAANIRGSRGAFCPSRPAQGSAYLHGAPALPSCSEAVCMIAACVME
eukprot:5375731-Pyramimonas_sp.AAC.1